MITQVVMPPLTETSESYKLVTWLKREGEPVQRGEMLFEVETDKAVLQVEALGAGVLRRVMANEGETANVGDVLAYIAGPDDVVP
jgi:pyruvate dehydrogenase E2 component (dihydrolipoamide acetyltransferase)